MTLAQSVLSSMSTYCMQHTWIPTGVCNDIDAAIRRFIWKGSRNHGIHLVNWDTVAQPRHVGGLGLRKARDHNIALLGKNVWQIINGEGKPWVSLVREKYGVQRNFCLPPSRVALLFGRKF